MALIEAVGLTLVALLIVGVLISVVIGTVVVAFIWKVWSKVLSFDEEF